MPRKFFIADTHFGHEKIIKYENRPFSSIEEMDEKMISNWNNVIQEEDEVYVLGDYSFYEFEKTKSITKRLKGKKYLVMGNHDEEDEAVYRDLGFINAYRHPIILEGFWILSHEPVYINKNMPYANIFGHVHGCNVYCDISAQSYCACVERVDYMPVEFNVIKKVVADSIIK